jgi:hypothetical protein
MSLSELSGSGDTDRSLTLTLESGAFLEHADVSALLKERQILSYCN